ncbi:MAG TPA: hypothetical protein DEF45_08650 [Rhodopirellula sp.]|nr:hypothetical protein [Rhodopirellula sp.]
MSLQIQRASLEHLQTVLPRLLSRLSIGRAQIALEHLRSNLQNRPHDEILFYLAREQDASVSLETDPTDTSASIAALIAIQQPSIDEAVSSDVATIVHADFLIDHASHLATLPENSAQLRESAAIGSVPDEHRPMPSADLVQVILQMRNHIDRDLSDLGIRFVQWATDATDQIEVSAQQWHDGLGFQKIATLDYLTGNVNSTCEADPITSAALCKAEDHEPQAAIELRPVALDHEGSRRAFAKLVEATYSGTLDCPRLADYRTTSETLRGYQTTASFAPELWFEVVDGSSSDNKPVGCMILAKHEESRDNTQSGDTGRETAQAGKSHTEETESSRKPAARSTGPVIEIVYMGLLPETRGQGFGRRLVAQAAKLASDFGGTRFILGVDRKNRPARDIYNAQGMTRLLSETVWAKRVL